MSISHARRRNLTLLSASVAAAGALAVPALTAGPASAAAVTYQSFTSPGNYIVRVPSGTTQVTVTALGGAGTDGFAGAQLTHPGGAGGGGTSVSATFSLSSASIVKAGEFLEVHVGALGGGAPGGNSDTRQFLGPGGKGGDATFVYDGSSYLVVAGGGGGGGAGASSILSPKGGYGGADGNGQPGIGYVVYGLHVATGPAGRGGVLGGNPDCTNGSYVGPGQPGETAPPGSYAGGGGGGGAGICGGQSGGSGDHGFGHGSGGGGGAGASRTGTGAVNVTRGPANSANNHGNGYAVVYFS